MSISFPLCLQLYTGHLLGNQSPTRRNIDSEEETFYSAHSSTDSESPDIARSTPVNQERKTELKRRRLSRKEQRRRAIQWKREEEERHLNRRHLQTVRKENTRLAEQLNKQSSVIFQYGKQIGQLQTIISEQQRTINGFQERECFLQRRIIELEIALQNERHSTTSPRANRRI
jgi:translation initiation factor 2 alpha subunit (eIF-2alpha)